MEPLLQKAIPIRIHGTHRKIARNMANGLDTKMCTGEGDGPALLSWFVILRFPALFTEKDGHGPNVNTFDA
jgi:hypothetical protein